MKEMRVINSLVKGLNILECVANARSGLKVSQIIETLEIPRSNVTLFLNSLVVSGYVIKNPVDNRYYISERLNEVATRIHPNRYLQLIHIATPEMQKIRNKFQENVLLGVLNVHQLRIIHREIAERSIQVMTSDEMLFTPHVTAGGKAILAFLSQERLTAYFEHADFQQFTTSTIVEKSKVSDQLTQIARNGFATNFGEYEDDVMAVASPIFCGGEVLASLILQFPFYRHVKDELEANAGYIMEASRTISEKLSDVAQI